jgi:hypothetical protein
MAWHGLTRLERLGQARLGRHQADLRRTYARGAPRWAPGVSWALCEGPRRGHRGLESRCGILVRDWTNLLVRRWQARRQATGLVKPCMSTSGARGRYSSRL